MLNCHLERFFTRKNVEEFFADVRGNVWLRVFWGEIFWWSNFSRINIWEEYLGVESSGVGVYIRHAG